MATIDKWGPLGTEIVVMTNANLSALANNALFLSSAINGIQGGGGTDGLILCRATLSISYGATGASANTGISFWFIKSQDGGTTYEAGGTGYTPLRLPDFVFPAPVDANTQRIFMRDIWCPPGFFEVLAKNDGTGQPLKTDTTSTGSKFTIAPYSIQQV